jgi:hypothetical protein
MNRQPAPQTGTINRLISEMQKRRPGWQFAADDASRYGICAVYEMKIEVGKVIEKGEEVGENGRSCPIGRGVA